VQASWRVHNFSLISSLAVFPLFFHILFVARCSTLVSPLTSPRKMCCLTKIVAPPTIIAHPWPIRRRMEANSLSGHHPEGGESMIFPEIVTYQSLGLCVRERVWP